MSFYYTSKTTTKDGSSIQIVFGQSDQAPMLTSGEGMVQVVSRSKAIDIKNTANLSNTNNPLNGLMMFGAVDAPKDNSLQGSSFYKDDYPSFHAEKSGGDEQYVFSFQFDPINKMSSVALGGSINIERTNKTTDETEKSTIGVGMNATSDPATSLYGSNGSKDPNVAYINVAKTTTGFRISYHKITKTGEPGFETVKEEELAANIGEPATDYEAVITPINCDYIHWLPLGPSVKGDDNSTGDTQLQFCIDIHKKGDPSYKYPGLCKVSWSLTDVTNYPGFCNNFPAYTTNPNTDPDLVFNTSMKQNDLFGNDGVTNLIATSKQGNANAAIAKIMCMDYAAWGKLSAIIILDDGTMLSAINNYNGKSYATLPLDKDENKLADEWEKTYNTSKHPLTWDEDSKPTEQRDNGDGYTLFEEYRGFSVYTPADLKNYSPDGDEFVRTDPDKKDAFIYDPDHLFQAYYESCNPSDLNWHYVTKYKDQMYYDDNDVTRPLNRWVNFNKTKDYFISEQYAVVLKQSAERCAYDPLATGTSYTVAEWNYNVAYKTNANTIPTNTFTAFANEDNGLVDVYKDPVRMHIEAVIFVPRIEEKCDFIKSTLGDDAYRKAVDSSIAGTVRHEIGHCIGIHHHQQKSFDGPINCCMRYLTNDERKDASKVMASRIRYCRKGDSGPDYNVMDRTGPIPAGEEKTIQVPAGTTSQDNCYGQISVKSKKQ